MDGTPSRPALKRSIIVVSVIALAAIVYLARPAAQGGGAAGGGASTTLPRLVDLGADKCVPCKMMAPILEELRAEQAGRIEVVFIDVWKNKEEAAKYGIDLIPTQIFFAADGRELFRHEGFFAKEEILAKWQELGVTPKGS
ncbi:MAG: thioredoxin family protein [bacterium]|nr:thioredoxin family protein [bacterium]MBK9305023.1 thioredoxin family protein [bacterium]